MDHFVEKLEIKNFKSIRDLTLTDFRRINLFIGRPNVGKSNLLEALGMFSVEFFRYHEMYPHKDKLKQFLRTDIVSNLFYDGDFDNAIVINCVQRNDKKELCKIELISPDLEVKLQLEDDEFYCTISSDFDFKRSILDEHKFQLKKVRVSKKRKYIFNPKRSQFDFSAPFLLPPYGENLFRIIENHPELRKTISSWFKEYNLRLVLDRTSNSIKIQKEVGDNEVFILPYSMIADTLQRLIFYKTAVASNQNSVLIFEEPEAHAFPPYIAEFTQEVIKSATNQFFIATHSPIVVNDFLENAREDLTIFMTDFKDGQTVARALTRAELEEVYDYGIDLFFNNEAYVV